MCHQCHSHKSYLEALAPFQRTPLASCFDTAVYEAFVCSPKPKQAVQQLHMPTNERPTEIDIRRCRRSGLEQNALPIPLFSPLDQNKARGDFELGDY